MEKSTREIRGEDRAGSGGGGISSDCASGPGLSSVSSEQLSWHEVMTAGGRRGGVAWGSGGSEGAQR